MGIEETGEQAEHNNRVSRVRFKAEIGEYKTADLIKENWSGCDALLLIPLNREFPDRPCEGSLTQAIFSVDGHNKSTIPDLEMFHCFAFMAQSLLDSVELAEWQIAICKATVTSIQKLAGFMIEQQKENPDDEPIV